MPWTTNLKGLSSLINKMKKPNCLKIPSCLQKLQLIQWDARTIDPFQVYLIHGYSQKLYYVKNKKCYKFLCFLPYTWLAFNQMPRVLMSLAKYFGSPIPFLFTPPWIEYEKQRIFALSVSSHLLPQNCKQVSKLNENSKWRCKYSAKIIGVWHKKCHLKWL